MIHVHTGLCCRAQTPAVAKNNDRKEAIYMQRPIVPSNMHVCQPVPLVPLKPNSAQQAVPPLLCSVITSNLSETFMVKPSCGGFVAYKLTGVAPLAVGACACATSSAPNPRPLGAR